MNSFVFTLCGILIIVAYVGANIGFKFHKWLGWVFIFLGFLGGLLFPLCFPPDSINRNPYSGLVIALIISFFIFFYGWKNRKNNGNSKAIWKKIINYKDD